MESISEQITQSAIMPGTVSRILWHFTGGPVWDEKLGKQGNDRKSPEYAYQNLLNILKSKQLKLGTYKEKVKAQIPLPHLNKNEEKSYRQEEILSSTVCCLADIPINHLSYMADRYGKFAIGFHRESAITHGFNPVFYALHKSKALRYLIDGFVILEGLDAEADTINTKTQKLKCSIPTIEREIQFTEIVRASMEISGTITGSRRKLQDFLAFVKTFEETEFATIFCEREWRAIKEFDFGFKDIAMIVVPRREGTEEYYFKIIKEIQDYNLDLDHHVPVVPWEDLIEN